jgi:alcohol dehydrogenase (cytochrome c)
MRRCPGANRKTVLGVSGLLALSAAMFAAGADVPVTDWPAYNRLLTSERYAPFNQINTTNAPGLKQLCVYDLAVEVSFQSGPIVIGRTLYVTTDKGHGRDRR